MVTRRQFAIVLLVSLAVPVLMSMYDSIYETDYYVALMHASVNMISIPVAVFHGIVVKFGLGGSVHFISEFYMALRANFDLLWKIFETIVFEYIVRWFDWALEVILNPILTAIANALGWLVVFGGFFIPCAWFTHRSRSTS